LRCVGSNFVFRLVLVHLSQIDDRRTKRIETLNLVFVDGLSLLVQFLNNFSEQASLLHSITRARHSGGACIVGREGMKAQTGNSSKCQDDLQDVGYVKFSIPWKHLSNAQRTRQLQIATCRTLSGSTGCCPTAPCFSTPRRCSCFLVRACVPLRKYTLILL